MTTFTLDKVSRNSTAAEIPAAEQAPDAGPRPAFAPASQWRPGRVVRGLASFPVSLYGWVSGPPLTSRERLRVNLAYVRNSQGRAPLLF